MSTKKNKNSLKKLVGWAALTSSSLLLSFPALALFPNSNFNQGAHNSTHNADDNVNNTHLLAQNSTGGSTGTGGTGTTGGSTGGSNTGTGTSGTGTTGGANTGAGTDSSTTGGTTSGSNTSGSSGSSNTGNGGVRALW